jgi:hypothetical protein
MNGYLKYFWNLAVTWIGWEHILGTLGVITLATELVIIHFFVCYVLSDVCCVLCYVCCVMIAAYCVLFAAYCVLFPVCCVMCAVWCLLCTVLYVLCAVYHVLCAVICVLCCLLCALCFVLCAVCYVLQPLYSWESSSIPVGGWVDLIANLDILENSKVSWHYRDLNPELSSPLCGGCSDCQFNPRDWITASNMSCTCLRVTILKFYCTFL